MCILRGRIPHVTFSLQEHFFEELENGKVLKVSKLDREKETEKVLEINNSSFSKQHPRRKRCTKNVPFESPVIWKYSRSDSWEYSQFSITFGIKRFESRFKSSNDKKWKMDWIKFIGIKNSSWESSLHVFRYFQDYQLMNRAVKSILNGINFASSFYLLIN